MFQALRCAVYKGKLTAPITQYIQQRGIWNWKREFNRDVLIRLQKDYDLSPTGIARMLNERRWEMIKQDHTYDRERHEILGSDISAANFVVARGGAVKQLGSDNWIIKEPGQKDIDVPRSYDKNWKLEAIQIRNMIFIYESFSNLANLEHLQYLGLNGGKFIDDWCMDHLVDFRDSLVCLDISSCPHVTENGIAALHKMRKLKRLRMFNMEGVKNPSMLLMMLEDMLPQVVIETDMSYEHEMAEDIQKPTFMNLGKEELQQIPGKIEDMELTPNIVLKKH